MNLTIEPTHLPAPQPLPPPAPPTRHRQRWMIACGAAVAVGVIAAVAVSFTMNDDDTTATAAADLTADTAAEFDVSDTDDGTGDASIDEMIVDQVWEGSAGKATLCPAFRDVKAAMPNLTESEIFDMGVRLSGGIDGMTPAQIDQLRELMLSEC